MRTCEGRELPELGWMGPPDGPGYHPDRFVPLSPYTNPGSGKPKIGGLWTSPVYDGVTAWATAMGVHCLVEVTMFATRHTVMVPAPDARIAILDTMADLGDLIHAYPGKSSARPLPSDISNPDPASTVNWSAMSTDFSAVWLTEKGLENVCQRHLADITPDMSWIEQNAGLYAWDCETILWLRPDIRPADGDCDE